MRKHFVVLAGLTLGCHPAEEPGAVPVSATACRTVPECRDALAHADRRHQDAARADLQRAQYEEQRNERISHDQAEEARKAQQDAYIAQAEERSAAERRLTAVNRWLESAKSSCRSSLSDAACDDVGGSVAQSVITPDDRSSCKDICAHQIKTEVDREVNLHARGCGYTGISPSAKAPPHCDFADRLSVKPELHGLLEPRAAECDALCVPLWRRTMIAHGYMKP